LHIELGVAEILFIETETELFIVAVAVDVHPASVVPVTVYTVLVAGDASTEDPVVADNPVAGDQE
jgi:hypothetical protein